MTIKENNLESSLMEESKEYKNPKNEKNENFEKSKITIKNSWIPDSMSEVSSPCRTPKLNSNPHSDLDNNFYKNNSSSNSKEDKSYITPRPLPKIQKTENEENENLHFGDNLSPEIAPSSNRTIKTYKKKQTLSRISSKKNTSNFLNF